VPDSPFFVNQKARPLPAVRLQERWRPACRQLGLNPHGPVPRVHDLRHSFALHRLYKWYADGHRPQDKLVLLSIYMGHVDLRYTEHYLQRSTDLLRLAGATCGRQLDDFLNACRQFNGG
jgi:integrase